MFFGEILHWFCDKMPYVDLFCSVSAKQSTDVFSVFSHCIVFDSSLLLLLGIIFIEYNKSVKPKQTICLLLFSLKVY